MTLAMAFTRSFRPDEVRSSPASQKVAIVVVTVRKREPRVNKIGKNCTCRYNDSFVKGRVHVFDGALLQCIWD